MSYARLDDEVSDGYISWLRECLEGHVNAEIGKGTFWIFQDTDEIRAGENWASALEDALAGARFLIPVLSPSYFKSQPCLFELAKFRGFENAAGRNDLIIPIYFRDAEEFLNDPANPHAALLKERQFFDWRKLRHKRRDDPEVMESVERLARDITKALRRTATQAQATGAPVQVITAPEALATVQQELEETRAAKDAAEERSVSLQRELALTRQQLNTAVSVTQKVEEKSAETLRNLQDKVAQLEADRNSAQSEVEQLRTRLAEIEQQRSDLEAKLAAPKELANPQSPSNSIKTAGWQVPPGVWVVAITVAGLVALNAYISMRNQTNTLSRSIADLQHQLAAKASEAEAASKRIKELETLVADLRTMQAPTPAAGGKSAAADVDPPYEPGDVFKDCAECPEMVVVPAGSFVMGSPDNEAGRSSDEGPQRRVTIARPFAVGKYEMTRGQFARFAAETGHKAEGSCYVWTGREWKLEAGRSWRAPGFEQGDDHPLVCVSWNDAKTYVAWLSQKTGQPYRLLSEAEWEYAARAGSQTRYSWGDEIGSNKANCYECGGQWDRKQTAPVGSFASNPFGLYDLHGNVWEWVEDCYHNSYSGALTDGSSWTGQCSGSTRVVRGGSWHDEPRVQRSAFRSWFGPESRFNILGFRVSKTLTP